MNRTSPRYRPPAPTRMTLNLAPMVDVLMCLIVFFLLATKLASAEHFPVKLPWAQAAQELDSAALGERVTINVRRGPAGAEYIMSDWSGHGVIERVLVPTELEPVLRSRAARLGTAAELRCVIRADADVRYEDVETALRACGLAQVRRIVFGVNAGPEPPAGTEGT